MVIHLQDIKPALAQAYLQHAIAPRPICFAATISAAGEVNLSPFSFFNLFSSNPPIVVFSPARRVRDNTTKHTLENVLEIPEVVINIVDWPMVQQISLASCEYPRGTNEFEKAGFTAEPATLVNPPMVKEAPIKLECKVIEVKPLGTEGGAGNLVIAEVLCMHIKDELLDETGMIHQPRLELVARLGGDWYCRIQPDNLFKVPKPNTQLGIGVDALPAAVRNSRYLTGNHLGMLANVHELPVVDVAFSDDRLKNIIQYFSINPDDMERELHHYAAQLLDQGKVAEAWQVILAMD
jgi:flavin reductase (DIM6/NTAB) family NADH-FMN oxidoreductase RutF